MHSGLFAGNKNGGVQLGLVFTLRGTKKLLMIRNPFCPTLSAPKEMLPGGFGEFYFYKKLLLRMALATSEDAAEMTRVVKVVRGRFKKLSSLSLSALTPIGMLRIQKDGARAGFPANSLLNAVSK
jgi:hypothetical protein